MTIKVFTAEELADRKYLDSFIRLHKNGMLGPYNAKAVELLIKEVERLQKGDFTEEELSCLPKESKINIMQVIGQEI